MPNISKLFKNKKILFVFLFFLFVVITIPQIAFAAWWNPFSWGKDIVGGLANVAIVFIFAGPMLFTSILATVTGLILKLVIATALSIGYTSNTSVTTGWPIVRDLANMMIVLGFVVIGIATALRIREYEARQLLAKLIIAALLVNFSLLICGIIIDATNILMKFFFNGSGDGVTANWFPVLDGLENLFKNIFNQNPAEFATTLLGMVFFNFIGIFVYLLYAVLILCRIVALWILVILSPLAFVCYVFPATKTIWNMWWKNFFQWCIVVIPAGLFYFIGSKMIESFTLAPRHTDTAKLLHASGLVPYIGDSISKILIPGMFLIVGFFISLQFAPAGASAIMNFANRNKGKIMAGGLSAMSKASGRMGAALQNTKYGAAVERLQSSSNFGARFAGGVLGAPITGANALQRIRATAPKTKSGIAELAEITGFIPPGSKETDEKQRLAEASRTIENIADNARLAQMAQQNNIQGAAAASTLAKRNAFNSIPKDKQEAVAANAVKFGVTTDTFKSHPHLITGVDDEKAKAELILKKAAEFESKGTTPKLAMDSAKLAKFDQKEIDDQKKIMNEEVIRQRSLGYAPVNGQDMTYKAKDNEAQDLVSKGAFATKEEALKSVEKFVPTTSELLKAGEQLKQERVAKAMQKLGSYKAAELPTEAVTPETVSYFSAGQIKQIGDKGSPELIDKILAYKYNFTPGATQSPEYTAAQSHIKKSTAPGSSERAAAIKRMQIIQNELMTNSNFTPQEDEDEETFSGGGGI